MDIVARIVSKWERMFLDGKPRWIYLTIPLVMFIFALTAAASVITNMIDSHGKDQS